MSQSTRSLFQVAMVDMRSVESPFLREGRSRKSGHTCSVCGAVFGLWASLAEHKEVHYNDRKSLSSQQPKLEKRRTLKSKKFVTKEQVSSKKETTPGGMRKCKQIDHLKHSPVTNALSTALSDQNFSQQNETSTSVGQCLSSSLDDCRSILTQKTELKSHVLKRTVSNLTEKSFKNTSNSRTPLSGDCSDTVTSRSKRKCRSKFNSESNVAAESLSSEHDDIHAEKQNISPVTEEKLSNLSEIVNFKSSVLNKNQHIYVKSSLEEYNSENIFDGTIDKTFSSVEVSCVNQTEVGHCFDASLRKKSKSKAEGSPERMDCLSKVKNPVLFEKQDFVWQAVSILESVKLNEVESKVCSEMSFTINSEELLDVEEEVVCTEVSLEPALLENSSQHRNKTPPIRSVPPVANSSDASKLLTNRNSCGGSHLAMLGKPEESHTEKPGIQMVSLLKTNQSSKPTTCPCNTKESCTGASTMRSSLLVHSKMEETEVNDGIKLPLSQFVLMKKLKQSGLGKHWPPKQMISLLKSHQNHVTITGGHQEETLNEHSSHNRNPSTSHSPQSAVGVNVVAMDAKVVATARHQSDLVNAKEGLNIESCNDAWVVASDLKCTSPSINSIDFVATKGTSQLFSEEIQGSPTSSDVVAKCSAKLLMDKTFGIPIQHQRIIDGKKEMVDLGTAADSKHNVEMCTKYLEMGRPNLSPEFQSAEIRPEQPVKALEPEKTEPYSDFKDLLKDSYGCLLCSEKFSNPFELDLHRKSQHLCLKCDRVFRQTSNLRKHLRVSHESYRPHRCETCGKCFPFLSSLKEHWLIHSGGPLERVHTCEVCGKAFTRASGLRKHSKEEHLDVKPYVCVLCHKSFAYLCSLRSHMRAHSSERPFGCDACDQRFKQSSNLRKHVRLHHSPKCNQCQGSCTCDQRADKVAGYGKSAICEVCGRACEGQKQLTIHMRVHTGEKPEVCDVCGKSFQHKSNLLKHQLKHSGTKEFACKFCDRAFYANHSLLSHMRLHTGESPFQCDACGKRFCTKNGLQVHSLLHSNMRPFACSTCGKTFTQLGNLNKHVALHTGERPFVCAYCDKGFVDSSALKRHALKHTVEHMHECSTCGKWFQHLSSLQSHELLHASEQIREYSGQELEPLVCVMCSKSFMHRSNYLRHVKRHRGMLNEVDEVLLNPGEYIVCLTE